MKNKALKILLAIILSIVFVFCGCSSEKELPQNSNEEITDNSLDTTVELQEEKNSSTEKADGESTVKESDGAETPEVNATGVDSSDRKNSDPNKAQVVFKDEEGKILKTEEVIKGDDATPPDNPEKDGYRFIGWNYDYEDVQTDITVVPVFEEITEPTLIVKTVKTRAGDKIEVPVSVQNNPGLLGMVVNLQYDDNALTLTEVSNGSLLENYMFTPPKNMKSGCNAAWNINDVPSDIQDGEIAILHFKVSEKAQAGAYAISVSCLNDAFDESFQAFSFESIQGFINVE